MFCLLDSKAYEIFISHGKQFNNLVCMQFFDKIYDSYDNLNIVRIAILDTAIVSLNTFKWFLNEASLPRN